MMTDKDRQPLPITLRGADLQRVMPLLEKHGSLTTSGVFDGPMYDGCQTTMTIELADGTRRERTNVNCRDDRMCPFIDSAIAAGIFPRIDLAKRGERSVGRGCHDDACREVRK
jgi:hypothetical protein